MSSVPGPPAGMPAAATIAVLTALRRPQDADQLSRAIEALCGVDPSFGSHLARALLEAASESGTEPRRAAGMLASTPPASQLLCSRHPLLAGAEAKLSLRWGRERLGHADLRLSGPGFGLALECRLAGTLGAGDRERLRHVGEPLLVVLPELAATADERLAGNQNWLGTVAWSGLIERLAGIPAPGEWAWLIGRVEAELYPAAGTEAGLAGAADRGWAELLEDGGDQILELVRDVVREGKPGLRSAAAAAPTGPVTAIDDGAQLLLQVPAKPEGWLFIGLSGRTREPLLRVAWEPLSSSKALKASIAKLRAEQPNFQPSKLGVYRLRTLEEPILPSLLDALATDIRAMTTHGLLTGAPRRTG